MLFAKNAELTKMTRIIFISFFSIIIFYGCEDVQMKKEFNQLKTENEKLKTKVDSLTNVPQNMYALAETYFQNNKYGNSINLLMAIREKYPSWEKSLVNKKLKETRLRQRRNKEKRIKIETVLNKYIKSKYDKFQKITWYETKRNTTKSIGNHRSLSVEIYFGKDDGGNKFFRIRSRYIDRRSDYHDTQWIFYETVILLGDNGYSTTIATDYPNKQSKNNSYGLQEWSDDVISEDAVLQLAKSKSISVRFNGKYRYSFKMNTNQLNAFKEIVEKYKRI